MSHYLIAKGFSGNLWPISAVVGISPSVMRHGGYPYCSYSHRLDVIFFNTLRKADEGIGGEGGGEPTS